MHPVERKLSAAKTTKSSSASQISETAKCKGRRVLRLLQQLWLTVWLTACTHLCFLVEKRVDTTPSVASSLVWMCKCQSDWQSTRYLRQISAPVTQASTLSYKTTKKKMSLKARQRNPGNSFSYWASSSIRCISVKVKNRFLIRRCKTCPLHGSRAASRWLWDSRLVYLSTGEK